MPDETNQPKAPNKAKGKVPGSAPQADAPAPEDAVASWLSTTGFAVEADTARLIHQHGYFTVEAPAHYADLDGKTVKELDVWAWRTEDARRLWEDDRIKPLRAHYFSEETIAEALKQQVTVSLRIECKYAVQPWVAFSAATDHATSASMTANFMGTKRAAKLLESLGTAGAAEAPLLYNDGILARSLRQAKVNTDGKVGSNTDDCYKAIMSVLVSSHFAVTQPRKVDEPLEITIPVIVIKGQPLFNAVTDENFDLSHQRVGIARLLYKLPNDMTKDYAVDVVHLDSLAEYIEMAADTAEGIIHRHAQQVYQALHQRALDWDRKKHDRPSRSSGWMG